VVSQQSAALLAGSVAPTAMVAPTAAERTSNWDSVDEIQISSKSDFHSYYMYKDLR
jgi:hypothetical protein